MVTENQELPAHRDERSGGNGGGGVESGGGGGGGEEHMMDIMYTKRGCCFWIPCFGSDNQHPSQSSQSNMGVESVWWERIRTAEKEDRWWTKGWKVLKKVREWSEIVAGPKWKTFIRRFRKHNHHHHHHHQQRSGGGFGRRNKKNQQYDPLSYALNFDEDGHLEEDFEYPDFSSRYASIPISAKSSMDLGKDGPNFI